jgi:hypothetical protein
VVISLRLLLQQILVVVVAVLAQLRVAVQVDLAS